MKTWRSLHHGVKWPPTDTFCIFYSDKTGEVVIGMLGDHKSKIFLEEGFAYASEFTHWIETP